MDGFNQRPGVNRDLKHRTEHAFQLWILEAKGIPAKQSYYCEICLDRQFYKRTSSKCRSDICFWGEYFEEGLSSNVEELCINIYRDANSKKKRSHPQLIGFVHIKTEQLCSRQPTERWYSITLAAERKVQIKAGDLPAIRLKARFQSVEILPLRSYSNLSQFIQCNYRALCSSLEPLLGVKAKEDFATSFVRILHKDGRSKDFLCDIIMSEVLSIDNEHLMFRGNSLATKAMEAYQKLVAERYLKETIGDFVKNMLESQDDCEVDPMKMPSTNASVLDAHRHLLMLHVEAVWTRILTSASNFPIELHEVFCELRKRLAKANRNDIVDNLISSSIFLRFLCPAIMSPSLFKLVDEYPCSRAARNFTLVAKTLQTLANFTKFGGKENYMEFMNKFVVREWNKMQQYLLKISCPFFPNDIRQQHVLRNDHRIDYGKELSLVHSYLSEVWTQEVHVTATADAPCLNELLPIITKLSHERTSFSEQRAISGVGITRIWNTNHRLPESPRNMPATNLHTNDDYVLSEALVALEDSLAMRQAGICVQQHRQPLKTRLKNIEPANTRPFDVSQDLPYADNDLGPSSQDYLQPTARTLPKPIVEFNMLDQNQTRYHRVQAPAVPENEQSSSGTPVKTVLNAGAPSSGYHSQSASTSNSNSPIEHPVFESANNERRALTMTNPMFGQRGLDPPPPYFPFRSFKHTETSPESRSECKMRPAYRASREIAGSLEQLLELKPTAPIHDHYLHRSTTVLHAMQQQPKQSNSYGLSLRNAGAEFSGQQRPIPSLTTPDSRVANIAKPTHLIVDEGFDDNKKSEWLSLRKQIDRERFFDSESISSFHSLSASQQDLFEYQQREIEKLRLENEQLRLQLDSEQRKLVAVCSSALPVNLLHTKRKPQEALLNRPKTETNYDSAKSLTNDNLLGNISTEC